MNADDLVGYARHYASLRSMSKVYEGTLIRRAGALQRFSGENSLAKILTEQHLNAFLASLSVSPYTRKSYRGDLLILWRSAADDGFVAYPITRRIRRERLPQLIVECFSADEAREILAVCKTLRGGLPNGVGRRHYWDAIIRSGWDSGLRRGDLWAFRRDALRPCGSAVVVQHKTGKLAVARFRPSTVAALNLIGGATPLGWPQNSWTFGESFRKLVKAAGVRMGTFRWLRRSSGSHVEEAHPGAGHKQLGHSDPRIFEQFYDAKMGGPSWPMPPEL